MYCTHCGTVLPEQANFCPECGTARQKTPAAKLACSVTLRQIDEKWSLFGKEIFRFEAVGEDGAKVAVSEKFTVTGFDINGPNEKNRKHKAAFDGLIKTLLAAGWQEAGNTDGHWFTLHFCKN